MPLFLASWPATSWLKYHIKYCIEKNKYFVYPYTSFSTCFSDVGVHTKMKETRLQVPLHEGGINQLNFPVFGDPKAAYYDSFFERECLAQHLGIANKDLIVDIYGHHTSYEEGRFVLSTKI